MENENKFYLEKTSEGFTFVRHFFDKSGKNLEVYVENGSFYDLVRSIYSINEKIYASFINKENIIYFEEKHLTLKEDEKLIVGFLIEKLIKESKDHEEVMRNISGLGRALNREYYKNRFFDF